MAAHSLLVPLFLSAYSGARYPHRDMHAPRDRLCAGAGEKIMKGVGWRAARLSSKGQAWRLAWLLLLELVVGSDSSTAELRAGCLSPSRATTTHSLAVIPERYV